MLGSLVNMEDISDMKYNLHQLHTEQCIIQ